MIREFRTGDLDAVMGIWLETNKQAHSFINDSYWQENYEAVKAIMPGATILVCETDDEIQGFIGLMDGAIAGLFVKADSQSRGLGRALLDKAKENQSELWLQVYLKNSRALEFYIKEGFTIEHKQVDENTGEIELGMKWLR